MYIIYIIRNQRYFDLNINIIKIFLPELVIATAINRMEIHHTIPKVSTLIVFALVLKVLPNAVFSLRSLNVNDFTPIIGGMMYHCISLVL